MLKRKKYVYECEDYKIINPSQDKISEIIETITKEYVNNNQIDYDNSKLNHYLFKELVMSDKIDYQFDKYSLSSFEYLMDNPTKEFKDIAYYLGDLLSDIMIEFYRIQSLEIKRAIMQLSQASVVQDLNILNDETRELKKVKKEYEKKKKIVPKEDIEVKRLNKLQIFLYNHGWIK